MDRFLGTVAPRKQSWCPENFTMKCNPRPNQMILGISDHFCVGAKGEKAYLHMMMESTSW